MLNIRKILYWAVTAVCYGLLPCECVKEDAVPLGEQHDVAMRLNTGTCAVDETDDTLAGKESTIHSLRVHAFVKGQLADHKFRSGDMETPATFQMDLTMASLTTGTASFYIITNEKAMSVPGAEKAFTENATEAELNNFMFTTLARDVQTYGPPMLGKESKTIDFSKLSNRQPIDPGHSGHIPLGDVLTFQLKHPVGKLGVFAAREAGEAGELCITDPTLLEAGTRAYNYLVLRTDETLKPAGATGIGKFSFILSSAPVAKALATNITPKERQNPGNYTPVLEAPFYPLENPQGSDSWNTPDDEHGGTLRISYTFGSKSREGPVYMPRVGRNKCYVVCCLMHSSGRITVAYNMTDQGDDGDYQLGFNYPSYELLQPFGGGTAPYAQPTVYYNDGVSSTAGTYSFRLIITDPMRQEWQSTLFDATAAGYELTVCQSMDGINTLVTPPYVASDTTCEIQIRALKGGNAGKQSSLGIAYTPKWDPLGSPLLLINMRSGVTNWIGSESIEKVVIRQVNIPTN